MKKRNWLIQPQSDKDADMIVIEKLLRRDKILQFSQIEYNEDSERYGKDMIPVGDIPYIERWLWKNHQKKMIPIEVPEILRKEEFLGRSYRIVDRDKIPYDTGGKYFIKNVSRLKEFNSALYEGMVPMPSTLPAGHYVVSSWVDIRSEFRVFVYKDEILAIQNYLGSPLVFPQAEKLMKMVMQYQGDDRRPKAYTLDIAVICKQDQTTDTILLEIHPFACCGLYGFADPDIPDMLEAGIQYYTEN